jgi:preprotein translocase subunit SecY
MFRSIANTFVNCFKIPELKSRILFTLGVLAVCRVIAFVRIPGLSGQVLTDFFNHQHNGGGLLGMYNLFAGGAQERGAIGTMGIMPYITATIIIQLLTAVWPKLSKLAREDGGRTKIIQYSRYLTLLVCLIQGTFFAISFENPQKMYGPDMGHLVLFSDSYLWWFMIQTVLLMTTGTMLLVWLGEQITERGIGNGVSLIITIGIVARLPKMVTGLEDMFFPAAGEKQYHIMGTGLLLLVLLAVVIGGVIAITQAQRKVPVQYAQRAVGRKMYAGGTSFMPLKVNYAGVMPIIFAQSILMFPQKIFLIAYEKYNIPFLGDIARALDMGSLTWLIIYALMILFFSYFWVATQFNEIQIADDLKKNGGYIPGVRPGQGTSDYLHKAMSRITLAGAVFLTIIATIPVMLYKELGVTQDVGSFFGGTSILITVGVMLDTMRQIESHLMMRHYDGFLKKGRIRGRF